MRIMGCHPLRRLRCGSSALCRRLMPEVHVLAAAVLQHAPLLTRRT